MIVAPVLFACLLLLVLAGFPIFIALLLAGLGFLFINGTVSPDYIPFIIFERLNIFPLMAIPFFIFAGNLLSQGKLAKYLIESMNNIVGRVVGGLGIATVLSYSVMAAMTGVTVAAIAAISPTTIKGMEENGYTREFSGALSCAGGTLAILIPPSICMILYGALGGVSIGKLFIAGIFPGFVTAAFLIIYVYLKSKRMHIKGVRTSFRQILHSMKRGIWLALLPIGVLGGIYGGLVTPTEAGALACVYTVILIMAYRSISIKALPGITMGAALSTAMIFCIIAAASIMSFMLTYTGIPQSITQSLVDLNPPIWLFWALIIGLMVILGCFLDPTSILVMCVPILMPLVYVFNIDPLQFGVVLALLVDIGCLTPPVGMNLFAVSAVNKIPIEGIIREIWPFLLILLAAVLIIVLAPPLSTWLPGTMMR